MLGLLFLSRFLHLLGLDERVAYGIAAVTVLILAYWILPKETMRLRKWLLISVGLGLFATLITHLIP